MNEGCLKGLAFGLMLAGALLGLLGLPELAGRVSAQAQAAFPMRVPRGFAARMVPGDPHDPLLRQVLPMEKIGLVQRERDGSGPPQLVLVAGGARRLREARDTAGALLAEDTAQAA